MNLLGKTRLFSKVDDALGVFHTHAVAGFLGGFLVGIFATAEGTAAFAAISTGGAIEGNGTQVGWQIVGAIFVILLNLIMTPLILFFIKYVLRIPLRMSDEVLAIGDDAIHGEEAYGFIDSLPYATPGRDLAGDPELGVLSGRSPPGVEEVTGSDGTSNGQQGVKTE